MSQGDRKPAPAERVEAIPQRGPSLHLDIIEDVFNVVWKRWNPAKGGLAKHATGEFADHAAIYKDHETALGAVASTFAGKRTTIRPAEVAGGSLAGVLLLPRFIALGPNASANRDLLFVRAAIAGAASRGPCEPGQSQDEGRILSETVTVARDLAGRYEGFYRRVKSAAQLELNARPAVLQLPEHERHLENLRRAALQDLISLGGAGESVPFESALQMYRSVPAEAQRAPQRSFFNQLMRSKAPESPNPGPLLLLGGPLTPTDRDEAATALSDNDSNSADKDATEHEAPVRDHVNQTTIEEDPAKDEMPSHSFEKIDFAENFDGGIRKLDGADDMEEQAESLDGVDLREMIRGGPEVATIYNAEIGDVGDIPDVDGVRPGEKGVTYDEWEHSSKSYRRDWVTLYPTRIDARYPEFGRNLARELQRTTRHALSALEIRRTERIARNRQLEGDDIDLDNVIEEYAERSRGGSPPGRLYIHAPRLERDVATCIMLDLSYSADSWVDNQRVLDVELAAACVLGEVADQLGDQISIQAFASNTRNICRAWTVKDWNDSWTVGRARLGALRPQGYTRIGPAIRHATAVLAKHPARKKHLILITDGKPTDFDRYEGSHGIHDVAWAVREARRTQVNVHALGIDPRAASMLPAMFGPGGWRILRHIADLPDALIEAYG
ncbi:MAG: VWA domain-containing protein [bacterium]|nr:VWA domain-containing protein [bacterium]